MPEQSRLISETETEETFLFVCEGCGSEGELTLRKRDEMQPFSCPEGCGAVYVPWTFGGTRRLKCVVKPVSVVKGGA